MKQEFVVARAVALRVCRCGKVSREILESENSHCSIRARSSFANATQAVLDQELSWLSTVPFHSASSISLGDHDCDIDANRYAHQQVQHRLHPGPPQVSSEGFTLHLANRINYGIRHCIVKINSIFSSINFYATSNESRIRGYMTTPHPQIIAT